MTGLYKTQIWPHWTHLEWIWTPNVSQTYQYLTSPMLLCLNGSANSLNKSSTGTYGCGVWVSIYFCHIVYQYTIIYQYWLDELEGSRVHPNTIIHWSNNLSQVTVLMRKILLSVLLGLKVKQALVQTQKKTEKKTIDSCYTYVAFPLFDVYSDHVLNSIIKLDFGTSCWTIWKILHLFPRSLWFELIDPYWI